MVNWREWDLMNLFKEPDNLPTFLAMGLPELSLEQQLYLFEMLHPVNRLIDFWCGHPDAGNSILPIDQWTFLDWQAAKVHLHPQLRTPKFTEDVLVSMIKQRPLPITQHLPITKEPMLVDSMVVAGLLPLLDGPKEMMSLVERCKQIRPVHPVTLESVDEAMALETLIGPLTSLEEMGYILLERRADKV